MFHREPEFWLQFSIITRMINKLSMRSTEQLKQSDRQTYDEGANNWIFSGPSIDAIRFYKREIDEQWFITPSVWHLASETESTPSRHAFGCLDIPRWKGAYKMPYSVRRLHFYSEISWYLFYCVRRTVCVRCSVIGFSVSLGSHWLHYSQSLGAHGVRIVVAHLWNEQSILSTLTQSVFILMTFS